MIICPVRRLVQNTIKLATVYICITALHLTYNMLSVAVHGSYWGNQLNGGVSCWKCHWLGRLVSPARKSTNDAQLYPKHRPNVVCLINYSGCLVG